MKKRRREIETKLKKIQKHKEKGRKGRSANGRQEMRRRRWEGEMNESGK